MEINKKEWKKFSAHEGSSSGILGKLLRLLPLAKKSNFEKISIVTRTYDDNENLVWKML